MCKNRSHNGILSNLENFFKKNKIFGHSASWILPFTTLQNLLVNNCANFEPPYKCIHIRTEFILFSFLQMGQEMLNFIEWSQTPRIIQCTAATAMRVACCVVNPSQIPTLRTRAETPRRCGSSGRNSPYHYDSHFRQVEKYLPWQAVCYHQPDPQL